MKPGGTAIEHMSPRTQHAFGVFSFWGLSVAFKEVSGQYDGPALEQDVLSFWRENEVFEKTLSLSKDRPRFSFNEGPPTANGKPGIHHVLARSFKDAFPRYKTMRGYYAPRKAGWDTLAGSEAEGFANRSASAH